MPPVKKPPSVRLVTRGARSRSAPESSESALLPPAPSGAAPARATRARSTPESSEDAQPPLARKGATRGARARSSAEFDESTLLPARGGAALARSARSRPEPEAPWSAPPPPTRGRPAAPRRASSRTPVRKPKRSAASRGRLGQLVPTEAALGWGLLYDLLCAPVWLVNLARGQARLRDGLRPLDRLLQFVLSARLTALLILLNLLVFAVELYARGTGWSRAAFIAHFALSTDGLGRGEHLPLLTHFFAHVDLMHLGGNMLALFVFGRVVERNLGPWRLLGCYLLAAVCSTALSLLAQGLSGRSVPTLGASGAVAGIVALGILLEPLTITFEALVPLPLFLVGWLAIAADFAALLGRGGAGEPVDHPAHLGGYLSVLLGYYVLKRQQREQARLGLLINVLTLLLMAGLWLR